MKKRRYITIAVGFIAAAAIAAVIGFRVFHRDTSYRLVTELSPAQIAVAQVLFDAPDGGPLRTIDLEQSEYETLAGILGSTQPRQYRPDGKIGTGPKLYLRLAQAEEIMFTELSQGSGQFRFAIAAEELDPAKGYFQINSSALSEFISQINKP